MYGGEVWMQEYYKDIDPERKTWHKAPCEKTHTKACKNILGVANNTTNIAAKAELGEYPIMLDLIKQNIKFYNKIVTESNKLTHHALKSEYEQYEQGKKSYITLINDIKQKYENKKITNITEKLQEQDNLEQTYEEYFFKTINSKTGIDGKSGNKLRTFNTLKTKYQMETYLKQNHSFDIIQNIAKIRLSAHKLNIEALRYSRPIIPADDRICKKCPSNKIEDEKHFILTCPIYDEARRKYLTEPEEPDDEANLIKILNTNDKPEIEQLGKYIITCMEIRKNTPDIQRNRDDHPVLCNK
jgi:hypothetical protein